MFKRAAGGDWTEVERIVSSDLEPGDSFGRGLTFQGNTLLAAAEIALLQVKLVLVPVLEGHVAAR